MVIEFVVEEAGCTSCAELIRETLGEIGLVAQIEVDEVADFSLVRFAPPGLLSADDVDRMLALASGGSGHGYRIKPGSWRTLNS